VTERFKKSSWRSRITSSDGYSVRVLGPTGLEYCDAAGCIRIDSESLPNPWLEVVVNADSIPDTPDRRRANVLERIQRSFASQGWRLTLTGASFDPPDG
jgi:hypothetical protein